MSRFRYATTKPDGRTCCAGNEENFTRCQDCKGVTMETESYAPPNPWALTTAQERERDSTPESRFWHQHKAERLRDLAEEHAEIYAHIAATHGPRSDGGRTR